MFENKNREPGRSFVRHLSRFPGFGQVGGKTPRALWPFALLLLVAAPAMSQAQNATTTALTANPTSGPFGTAVNMTASVSIQGTSTHPLRGSVTFIDQVGTVTHVLGVVQVQSTLGTPGRAVLKQTLGNIGSHSITATFSATSYFKASTSSAQTVNITGTYPTTTSLASTGGVAGNWSLTATVVGLNSISPVPTGMVSLEDFTNGNYLLGTANLGAGTIARQTVAGTGSPIAVGATPTSVVSGDFNGDGLPDLAVLNTNDQTISILLGNGSGGFTVSGTKPNAGANPVGLLAADINGDGNIDLVVMSNQSNQISFLAGNGDGTFKAAKNSGGYLTTFPYSMALGDFNGDGLLDLVVVYNNYDLAAIFTGDGAGGFTTSGTFFNLNTGVIAVAVGDFNGDGHLDFATVSNSSASITIMAGDGTGNAFNSSTINLPNGSYPSGITVADFNGDGKLDLAVTESNSNRVAVLLGNGNGTFGLPANYATGANPIAVTTGDFNADGIRDLVVANQNGTSVTVLLGTGTGTFQTPATIGAGNGPAGLAVADFNGDGNGDIAVTNQYNNNVSIFLNEVTDTASASFNAISIPGSGNHQVFAAYASDANFAASTSNKVSLAATPIVTTTLLSADQSTYSYGQQAVLTATVVPNAVGTLTPLTTDTVTFFDGTTSLGSVTVSGGVAVLNTTSLSIGTHSLTAKFGGDANFVVSTSAKVTVTVKQTTPVITWNTPAPISYGTLLWTTQQNATATYNGSTVPGTFVYSPAPGTILGVGTQTLSVTFTPTDPASYTSASGSTTIQVTKATPPITWPTPAQITYGTPLDIVQLNATATNTIIVPLTSYYNVNGLYTNGTSFSTGGFDGGGNAYSSNSLGTSVLWNGITYPLGPTNVADAVANLSTNIPVPVGYYANLQVLGAMVNNSAFNYTFTLNYTDGTSVQAAVSMSDWVYPQGFSSESTVKCNINRNTSTGGVDTHSVCVYGYTIPVNSSKILQSIQVPQSREAVILAMGVTTPPVPGNFTYTPASGSVLGVGNQTLATSFTPTDTTDYNNASASVSMTVNQATTTLSWAMPAPIQYGTPLSGTQLNANPTVNAGMVFPTISPAYRQSAIFNDGQVFSVSGVGNSNYAYSATLLGSSILWNGTTFPLGPVNLPSSLTSSTVALPPASFNTLYFLGASLQNQGNLTFTVNYTDGSSTSVQQNMSSWTNPQNYPGESIASTMTYLNGAGGTKYITPAYVYGYSIPLNSAKVLQSITLPNNTTVVVLSIALSTTANPAITVPGVTTYNPPSGTILPIGTNPLAASFTPTDTVDYSSATATTSIVVVKATTEPITLTASINPASLSAPVKFTATVPSTATGTVTFFDGTTNLGTATMSSGVATFTTSTLATGTHSITAVYNGDTNYSSVTSTALAEVINKATATVSIAGVPNPSAYVQTVTMTITVSGLNGITPTGTVTLKDGAVPLGSAVTLDATGKATYSTFSLSAGSHVITATYSGDGNYN